MFNDKISLGISGAGFAIAGMATWYAYTITTQTQAVRINFIATTLFIGLLELMLHSTDFYTEKPELGRFTLCIRNMAAVSLIMQLYLSLIGARGTPLANFQNRYAANMAAIGGIIAAQFGSHLYSFIRYPNASPKEAF